jgi:hypothetical protein
MEQGIPLENESKRLWKRLQQPMDGVFRVVKAKVEPLFHIYIYKIGFRLKEVPVIFVNRVEGTSKMSGGIFGEAFFGVMRLRLDGWFRQYPRLPIV